MDTDTMTSAEENEVPTVDTTSSPRLIQLEAAEDSSRTTLCGPSLTSSKSSCLPPLHSEFPELSRATDIPLGVVHGRSALSPPPSSALTSTITPPTDSPPLSPAPPSVSSRLNDTNLPVSSPPSTAPPNETISEYFLTKVPPGSDSRNSRVQCLVQAAKAFWEALKIDQKTFEDVSTILSKVNPDFLSTINIAHHVELRLKDKQTLHRGEKRLSAALKKTAEDLCLKLQEVKTDYQQSKRYMELTLLPNGGPGSLLLMGRRVSIAWRRRLRDGDVKLLLDYREKHMPHHHAKAVKLNPNASRVIIKYMVANGSRYEVLASIQSELMCCLRRHVDLEQLAREEGVGSAFTHTLPYPGGNLGNLSPDHRASEETSEELALLELLLDAAEDRDITEFMKPFQEDDQWTRGPFPTMTQPAMEPFNQNSHFDTLPDIPVPTRGSPSHCLARVDSRNWVDNQIDVVASGNIHEHNWLGEDTLPLGWCLEASSPFEAQNSPGPEEPPRMK